MEKCDVFLEKHFFRKYYLQLDLKGIVNSNNTDWDVSELDIDMKMSFYEIKWIDFYQFNYQTNVFIVLILSLILLILMYISFSKLYLKRIIKKLQNKKF